MLVFSPPMKHTLQGQTVKDREGRGNWEQAVQWLAAEQQGRGEEMSTSQSRLCGRRQHQSLWDKRGIMFQCAGLHLPLPKKTLWAHLQRAILPQPRQIIFLTIKTTYLQLKDKHLDTFYKHLFVCLPCKYCILVLLTECSKRRACISACVLPSCL